MLSYWLSSHLGDNSRQQFPGSRELSRESLGRVCAVTQMTAYFGVLQTVDRQEPLRT